MCGPFDSYLTLRSRSRPLIPGKCSSGTFTMRLPLALFTVSVSVETLEYG